MPTDVPSSQFSAPVWLDRKTPPHIATLVLLTGLSALSLNMLIPSLPGIAAHYGADYGLVTLALAAYLGLTALIQLVVGPLSDRFGRRPVIIGTYVLFLAATLGCVVAPNVATFLLLRMVQSAIASGIALSRAIVRDMVTQEQAASQIAYVTMGMSLVPMVSPMIGGFLDQAFGWQSVFLFMFIVGAAVTVLIWLDLGETNLAPSTSFAAQFGTYPELLRSRPFWGYSLTCAFASGAFFALLGAGPWVGSEMLQMSPADLGLHFGIIALGYLLGNYLSGRFSTRVGMHPMMLAGGIVGVLGVAIVIILFALGIITPLSFFGPVLLLGVGNGLLLPSANAGIVSVRPHLAGSASGLGGALMVGFGAAVSTMTAAMIGPGAGAWPLLIVMLVCALLCLVATLDVMRATRDDWTTS